MWEGLLSVLVTPSSKSHKNEEAYELSFVNVTTRPAETQLNPACGSGLTSTVPVTTSTPHPFVTANVTVY
jgi:hypothetical protein